MSEFLADFLEGAKETPRAWFAPLIAIWRLLYAETSSLLTTKRRKV